VLRKVYKLGFAVVGAILALHLYARAQTSNGSISGVVVDESGLAIMTSMNERLKVDFRAEFFNLLNGAQLRLAEPSDIQQ